MNETIIGFSEGYHDAAISIIEGGKVLFASQSERFTKVKNDKILGEDLVRIAKESGASKIGFYEKPLLKKTRQFFAGQYKSAFSKKKYSLQPTHHFGHHLSHAAAAFQTSSFERSTVIIVDSIGEWDTVSVWLASYNNKDEAVYKKVWSKKYPYSIGLFYSAITDRVGLKPNEDEYILMGMSSYGDVSILSDEMLYQLQIKNNHRGCRGLYTDYSDYDISANAQHVVELELESIFKKAIELTGITEVCYGGGVALNCVANSKMRNLVSDLWIFPNPGDAGSSLGAAALIYKKKIEFSNCFLGYEIPGEYPVNKVINSLLKNEVVGVANGKAEFGPRALGNRSLLADPRSNETKDKVNEIKRRQKFRPFAPMVLEEFAKDWFDIDSKSDFMQYTFKCKRPNEIPAVCHIDETSRVQTVNKENTGVRRLLEAWYHKTGCPVLLNTSLNIKGQPIVNDENDAKDFSSVYGVEVFTR